MDLLAEIRTARRELPGPHRTLLDQLNVQETVVHDWPEGIVDLYRSIASEQTATVPRLHPPASLRSAPGGDPMATDPLSQPQPPTFAASKLPPLLRALADPEGKGDISAERAASIKQVETHLARYRKTGHAPPRGSDDS
jgi:hypothetical protein